MSFDRYLAVTEALYSNSKLSSLRMPIASYIITVLGWVISVLLCIQLYTYSTITSCKLCAYHFPLDVSLFFCLVYLLDMLYLFKSQKSLLLNFFSTFTATDFKKKSNLQLGFPPGRSYQEIKIGNLQM